MHLLPSLQVPVVVTEQERMHTHHHHTGIRQEVEVCGQKTFTEVMLMQILGRTPRPVDLRIADVVRIVLMEHGLTPSAIATRLIYMSAPENLQGAVSAGLLAVGSSFVGTMENCARLLDRIMAASDPDAEALAIARECKAQKSAVPGFGHHLHKPVYIGEVKADGQFNVVWKTKGPIKAQPWSPFIPGNDKKKDEPALMADKKV